MFFFNRKKLVEIDNKLDELLLKNVSNDERLLQIADKLSRLENRVDNLENIVGEYNKNTEVMMGNSIGDIQQNIKTELEGLASQIQVAKTQILDSKTDVIQNICDSVRDSQRNIESVASKNMVQMDNDLNYMVENVKASMDEIVQIIHSANDVGYDRQKDIASDIEGRFDLVEQSLKLLLMNSIMDQIDEE